MFKLNLNGSHYKIRNNHGKEQIKSFNEIWTFSLRGNYSIFIIVCVFFRKGRNERIDI